MRRAMIVSVPAAVVLLGLAACSTTSTTARPGPTSVSVPVPGTPTPAPATSSATSTPSPAGPTRSRASTPTRSSSPTSPSTTPTSGPTTAAPAPVPAGTTVVLNPGHDGGDAAHPAEVTRQVYAGYGQYKACDTTGTETDAGYSEHAFNWSVAQSAAAILRAHGITVILTRRNDTGVGPCVDQRAAIGNHAYVAAVVSIHADGAAASGHGFHVNQDDRRPEGASAAVAAASDLLGRDIHAALVRSSGLVPSTYIGRDGYFYRHDLAGLNLASRPATFLELGNMRNAGDAALQSSAAGRGRIATAVADGILAYLGR